jgi:hypothetical protein
MCYNYDGWSGRYGLPLHLVRVPVRARRVRIGVADQLRKISGHRGATVVNTEQTDIGGMAMWFLEVGGS